MPNLKGPGTHLGYMTPPPGNHSPCYKEILRTTYGECRSKHPGEQRANKSMCAAIAHTVAKGKCRQ